MSEGVTISPQGPVPVDLIRLQKKLLETAHTARAHRAAHTVHGGDGALHQTALALLAGTELAEHDSPPEATLQVLAGRIRLQGQHRQWDLGAGELITIPPERHAVAAIEDSVFLLTVRRDAS